MCYLILIFFLLAMERGLKFGNERKFCFFLKYMINITIIYIYIKNATNEKDDFFNTFFTSSFQQKITIM